MANRAKLSNMGIFVPTSGPGSALELVRPIGLGDVTVPGSVGERTVVYVNDTSGGYEAYDLEDAAPGETPSGEFTFFITGTRSFFEEQLENGEEFHLQRRFQPCASLDNPAGWRNGGRVWHYPRGLGQTGQQGGAPQLRGAGTLVENSVTVSWLTVLDYLVLGLTAVATGEATQNMLCIAGIQDKKAGCGAGYPGPDKVLWAGFGGEASAKSKVMFSLDGGATWTSTTNQPFGATLVPEDISWIGVKPTGDGYRVIVARGTTDAGNPAEVATGDVANFSSGAALAITWTNYDVGADDGEFITSALWLSLTELYVATDQGLVYKSENQGETWTEILDNAGSQINALAADTENGVWAVGATNYIAYKPSNTDTFGAKVGPSGGGTFYSIVVANDGVIYAGNATYLFRCEGSAKSATSWSNKKNFGTNKLAKAICLEGIHRVKNGDSELVRVVVDNTAGAGEVWESIEGAAVLYQITALTNTGYNGVYQARIGNKYLIPGDAGTLHQLSQ